MSATFTPGPWRAEPGLKKRLQTFVTATHPQGRVIICQTGFGHGAEENRANTRLISAAPELYAALVELADRNGKHPAHHRALAALAKARGDA